ncbi:hypothetical protein ACHAWF_003665 [Thalassiosira exigua]
MKFHAEAFLLAATLAFGRATPTPAEGEEAAASSATAVVDVDGAPLLDSSDSDLRRLLSPVEFLRTHPPSVALSSSFPTSELHSAFERWKASFDRVYDTDREHATRKLIWLGNHALIEEHNGKTSPRESYEMGHNDFSDLTRDEFLRRNYLGEHSPGVRKSKGFVDGSGAWPAAAEGRKLLRDEAEADATDAASADDKADEATVADVPDSKDWREDGAVTKVKNQWFCGSCWAFSAVGAIEGARYLETGDLTDLSVQQLIDCDKTDLGCGGGLMDQAFAYGKDAIGMCSLEQYPYAMHRHWFWGCQRYGKYCSPLPNSKVKKFVDVDRTEEALKAAIATQPVSVAVSAGMAWQFYRSGIYHADCEYTADGEAKIDHGVLAVGYGHYDPSTDPKAPSGAEAGDYWLIKNSWGSGWGIDGYIRLGRGTGNEANNGTSCVLSMASRPILLTMDA